MAYSTVDYLDDFKHLHCAAKSGLLRYPWRKIAVPGQGFETRKPSPTPQFVALVRSLGSDAGFWLEWRPVSQHEHTVSKQSDRLFAQPLEQVPDFVFNEDVVRVFPDMIKRSVPGYPTIVENLGVLAARFAQPHTALYDLGASLGAVTQSLRRHVRSEGCQVIAVDNSAAMVERCRQYLAAQDSMFQELLPVQVLEADILALPLQPASVVAMNFTLQFIAPEQRLALLGRIRQALLPGGALILSEKLRFADDAEQALLNELHLDFKRANGYSELEIAQKRSAIENVMKPDTFDAHKERLLAAGFTKVVPWFQCLNFASLIALP